MSITVVIIASVFSTTGKTIMAGLLIKELKARGLVKRILVVTPANLTFQWQRELKDRFRENLFRTQDRRRKCR